MADDERRAEIEAVNDALEKIRDRAKYLSEPAWTLEGCALVGKQIYEWAAEAGAELDRVRDARGDDEAGRLRAAAKRVLEADMRGVRDLDALNALEDAAGFSQQGEDHEPCATCGDRGWHTAGGNDPMACGRCSAGEAWSQGEDHQIGMGEALAMARLEDEIDRLRRRIVELEATPRSPQGEDHEAGIVSMREALNSVFRDYGPNIARLNDNDFEAVAWRLYRAAFPVSGTEPDTAKLVEALREIAEYHIYATRGASDAYVIQDIAREALAGFSVDAEKRQEESK